VALALLAAGGAADMLSATFRATLWNKTIPDAVRGRMAGIEQISYGVGPSAGQLRAGMVAELVSTRFALWSGGLACAVAVGLTCLALPGFLACDVPGEPAASPGACSPGPSAGGVLDPLYDTYSQERLAMPVFAVTGASGHLGGLAVQQLLALGIPPSGIVAVVRTRGTASDLAARGAQVRVADSSRSETLGAALAGVDRLLLVSGNEDGQRVVHHANVACAARTAGVSRIVYTSMLNADQAPNPIVGDHLDSELAIRESGVPFTFMRNGLYLERYTDHLSEYLEAGEIVGAAGNGRISPASRQDYAAAAATVLLDDEAGNRTYELGGPAIGLPHLAQVISEVTGTRVTYRDLPAEEYADVLQRTGLDEETARVIATVDSSIARRELETSSSDLANLLGHAALRPAKGFQTAYDLLTAARHRNPGGQ
jgi:NAD(P)H dehydrogenase (quinone)